MMSTINKTSDINSSFDMDEELRDFLNEVFLEIKKSSLFSYKVQDIRITALRCLRYSIIVNLKLISLKGDRGVVVKITKNSDGSRFNNVQIKKEWQTLNALDKEFGSHIKNVIKPLLYFENGNFQAMITEEIKGKTLHSILIKDLKNILSIDHSSVLKQHLYSCGKWLRKFQDITKKNFDREVIDNDLFNKVYKQLEECDRQNILNRRLTKELHNYVATGENLFNKSSSPNLVGTHSDFIPINIMVREDSGDIIVLDFTNFKYSLAYRDAVSFLCSLDFLLIKFPIKKGTIKRWGDYFLEGYGKLDKNSPVYKLCYIRENLAYLINLHCIPGGSRLKNITVMWSANRIRRNLRMTIGNGGVNYENG